MSVHTSTLEWKNVNGDFSYEKYNRHHTVSFSGNQNLKNSAAPDYLGNADMANPEELFAASLASCHMLTFLAIASKSGYVVDSYKCKADAILGKNAEGKMSVPEVNLYPEIKFSGDKQPTAEQLASMHEKSHKNCFIAQSVTTKVNVF